MYWMNSTACSPKIIIPDLYNHHHHRIAPTARCEKTAEERFNMLARGWLAYPVTPTHHTSTAEERLYKRHPGMRQRRITPRNPIRTTRQRRAHGASAGTTSMRFGDALLPPLGAAHPHRKNRHHHRIAPSARYTTIGKKPPSSHCAIGAIHRHRRKPPKSGFTC